MVSIDMSSLNDSINQGLEKVKSYIASLNQNEKTGWLLILGGIVLAIVAMVLW